MTRVKRGVMTKKRHKKILKLAKGYRGAKSKLYKQAKESVRHALNYAFKGRKERKRDLRALWIVRINAKAHEFGTTYNKLISGLKKAGIAIDRKILAEIAVRDSAAFHNLCMVIKTKS